MSDLVVWGRCPKCSEPCFKDHVTGETDPDHRCPPRLGLRKMDRRPYVPRRGRVVVFHGTHSAFGASIQETGLMPPPERRSKGARVALDAETAWGHARAWACFLMAERGLAPQGILAMAEVTIDRVREDGRRFVVPGGLGPVELQVTEVRDLPECFDPEVARVGLSIFEQLSEPRERPGIVVPRSI